MFQTPRGAEIQSLSATSFQFGAVLSRPGVYILQVINPDGNLSNLLTFNASGTLAPVITAIDPTTPAADPDYQVIAVSGANFLENLTVRLTYPDDSSTVLRDTFIGPVRASGFQFAGPLTSPGSYSIQVNNPAGPSSNVLRFNVAAPH